MPLLSNHRALAAVCGALALLLVSSFEVVAADGPPVKFKSNNGESLSVLIDDEEFTVFNYAPNLPKPFLSPVKAKGGTIVTRPLNDPEDKDHPHHKGIWLSVDEVNEVKFWAEKGKIRNIEHAANPGSPGTLKMKNHWLGEDDKPILIEDTVVSFYPNRLVTYDVTFTPAVEKVVFEDTKEGLFGVRVATTMREKVGGVIVNAEGKKTTKECWGQPSRWVDYSGEVSGKMYGVTMMDHPDNFRRSRYHVRDYGLFSMSPFGEGAYQNDKAKAQPVTLEKGKAPMRLRFALYVHQGGAEGAGIEEAYKTFVAPAK